MREFRLLIALFLGCCLGLGSLHSQAQNPRFVNPVDGQYGKDYIIVNYVDWQFNGILDHACGTKTYDGHQGTDYVLKSFAQMDSGVNVLAVDTGVIIAAHDGEFDREMQSDTSKKLGNFIGIKHRGKLFTYYAHLKKNSLLVNIGDTVYPHQPIAQIASSGNSSDPHLHFELWYDSAVLIDPFAGTCGNAQSYWLNPPNYDSSYNLWESGIIDFEPTLNQLRERPLEKDVFISNQDSVISFWNLQYGLKAGDVSRIEWRKPDNSIYHQWELTYQKDWWYHYYWSFIPTPPDSLSGEWTIRYLVNNNPITEHKFTLKKGKTPKPWALPGAEWHYDIDYAPPVSKIDYHRVYCDSIINFRRKECSRINIDYCACNNHFCKKVLTYKSNDSVFFFNPDMDAFQLLYDFSAKPNDTWQIMTKDKREDWLDTLTITVDAKDTVQINNTDLTRLHLTYFYNFRSKPTPYRAQSVAVEKLGDLDLVINIVDQYLGVCDIDFIRKLRCFQDSELGFYSTEWRDSCTYSKPETSVSPLTESNIKIYPNPAQNQVFIDVPANQNIHYQLFNTQGKMVLEGSESIVDIRHLPEGAYFLVVNQTRTTLLKFSE